MPSTRDIKRRIKSISNTQKITKAMEMVAAAKMRKAQDAALKSRTYAQKALEILANVSRETDPKLNPLLEKRKVRKTMILLITTDRGLCGGLNTNILKKAVEYIDQNKEKTEISLIAVGKKGRDFVQRYGQKIFAEFTDFGDKFDIMDISPIAQIPLDDFVAKNTDKVVLIYTDFVSTIMQKPVIKELLPLTRESLIKLTEIGKNIQEAKNQKPEAEDKKLRTKNLELRTEIQYEYTFEPTPEKVLAVLLPRLVEMQIYQAMLESNASEHSARMVAMKNASDNALEIIDELNLSYNQARQASITKEIAEISAGKAALEE